MIQDIVREKKKRLEALVQSIIARLEDSRSNHQGVDIVLEKFASLGFSQDKIIDVPPRISRHNQTLREAISGVVNPKSYQIISCLNACLGDLVWKEDESHFYEANENPGLGYTECNLHTQLIGPKASVMQASDFMLGIFMLGRWTFYRDHNHEASELYLNLSDRSGWRFNFGKWQDLPSGSIVWNPRRQIHATRVYGEPFISVFVWLDNISCKCNLIYSEDWSQIEQDLLNEKTKS